MRNLISFHHRCEGRPSAHASRDNLPIDRFIGESSHVLSGIRHIIGRHDVPPCRVYLPGDRLEDVIAGGDDHKKLEIHGLQIVASAESACAKSKIYKLSIVWEHVNALAKEF